MHPSNYGQLRRTAESVTSSQQLLTDIEDWQETHTVPHVQDMATPIVQHAEASDMCSSYDSSGDRQRSGSWKGIHESDEDIACRLNANGIQNHTDVKNEGSMGFEASNSYHCSEDSVYTTFQQNQMRRKLRFFFMNPVEKWHAKRRFPWKLLVQILKILFATLQLSMFASQRFNHVSYLSDTTVSLSHLFIANWDSSREVNVYPPSAGPLSLYKRSELFNFIDFSMQAFVHMNNTPIGSYQYQRSNESIEMPELCFYHYKSATINPYNSTFTLDRHIVEECIAIPQWIFNGTFSSRDYLDSSNHSIDFLTLLNLTLRFPFRTVKLTVKWPFDGPECYLIHYLISLDNRNQNGQMLIKSEVLAKVFDCKGSVNSGETSRSNYIRGSLNVITIVVSSVSLVMCVRSLIRAQQLRKATQVFFGAHFERALTFEEKFKFTNLWYVLICVNDVLLIVGSIIKIALERVDYEGYLDRWNACSLCLGVGNALVWFGCLRYLSFFAIYNVMILTLKHCFDKVIRYLICIFIIFAGFSFSGWLILSPYHLKFRSLASTVETLFSIMNGDDMYATYAMLEGNDPLIWWFCRLYLYTFIALFTFVILSLCIAIIMDSYETIKKYYERGFPMCGVLKFAYSGSVENYNRDAYLDDDDDSLYNWVNAVCCWCRSAASRQYEQLPT